MRPPMSLIDATLVLSCFVTGSELLLLFAYVRTEILYSIKKRLYKQVESELLRIGRYAGSDPPMKRFDLDKVLSMICLNSYGKYTLATLAYVLCTFVTLSLLSIRFPSLGQPNLPTNIASASVGVGILLVSQWVFLKLSILPFYARMYNRLSGDSIAVIEKDPLKVTFILLSPSIAAFATFATTCIVAPFRIDWWVVAKTIFFASIGTLTSLISWALVEGFALPGDKIESSVSDAVTATLWVNNDNAPEEATHMLKNTYFYGGDMSIGVGNIHKHIWRDNFSCRKLVVDDGGDLKIARSNSNVSASAIMVLCSVVLFFAPFVVLAWRADLMDGVTIAFQIAVVFCAYLLYVNYTNQTSTMRRISKVVH